MRNTLAIGIFLMSLIGSAQEFAPLDKSPLDAAYYPANAAKRKFAESEKQRKELEPKIRVLYSRPSLKERDIFRKNEERESGITQYGKPWRLGANESTELLLMDTAVIGGQKIPAGRYSIVVTPFENEWRFHINSENDGWGNYSYNSDFNLVTVSVPVITEDQSIENLSISLYSPEENNVVHMRVGWGKYRVELPITI